MSGKAPEIAQEVLDQRKQLVEIYIRAQERLVKQLTSAKLTDFAKFRINEQLVQINAIIGALNAEVKNAMPGVISGYYQHGANIADVALNAQGVSVSALNMGNRIHTAAVQAVAEQMALDLATANGTMKTTATRILRQTQQTLIQEHQVNQIIAEGIVTGESRRETSARLKEALLEQIGDGKLVQAGGRFYTPEYYSELVTRTRTREAVTQGAVTRSIEYGITLFQVSIHDGPCDRCSQYQGKVYSLTPDSGFPMLENRPPFHPHCAAPDTEVIAPGLRAAYESWYEGPMVRLKLGNGRTVTVTKNHYFLAPERFIKAGEITTDTRLVCDLSFRGGKRIDEVAIEHCRTASTFRTGDHAFHGDGEFMRGDLSLRIMSADPLVGKRGTFGDLPRIRDVTGDPTRRDNSNEVNARGLGAIIDGPLSGTSTVAVLSVEHIEYRGFVYDLETATGLYYADGLVSSNCRHVLLPYVQRPGKEAQHEAIKAFSNIPAPGAPGYDAAVAQARATGGLRKKQLPGETISTMSPFFGRGEKVGPSGLPAADFGALQKTLGKTLKVTGYAMSGFEGDLIREHVAQLDRFKTSALQRLQSNGLKTIEIGPGSVAHFPGYEHLANKQARGHMPGVTYSDIAGAYDSGSKRLILGTQGLDVEGIVPHEIGHAMGDLLGIYENETLNKVYTRNASVGNLKSYYLDDGKPSRRGMEEFLADRVKNCIMMGYATTEYGPEFYNFLVRQVIKATKHG